MAQALTFRYPVAIKRDRDAFLIAFPDLPEAITWAPTREDALKQAEDCLEEAIAGRIADREAIPPASPRLGRRVVQVPLQTAAKAALYLAMREAGIGNTGLARRLGCDEKVVRRMLNPRHRTNIDALARAIEACGGVVEMAVSLPHQPAGKKKTAALQRTRRTDGKGARRAA